MNTETKNTLKLARAWIILISKVNLITFFTVSCSRYAYENGDIGGVYGLVILCAMILVVADIVSVLKSTVFETENEENQ